MSKRNRPLTVVPVLTLLATFVLLTSSYKPSRAHRATPQDEQVEVVQASGVATSTEPLRGTPPDPVSLDAVREKKRIRLNPNRLVILGPGTKDPVLQSTVAPTRRSTGRAPTRRRETPRPGMNFEGIGQGFGRAPNQFRVHGAPPDTTGAVGETQYVQWVNESLAIFNKTTGAIEVGPIFGNKLCRRYAGETRHPRTWGIVLLQNHTHRSGDAAAA